MNNKFISIENALSKEENKIMLDFFTTNKIHTWFDGLFNNFEVDKLPIKKILNKVNDYFDLSKMVGVECWSHINTHPDWHIDMDDVHFLKTGEVKLPICSIVYYAKIQNMIGGSLMVEDEIYVPKTNDIVTFKKGLSHNVENFTGERIIIAINPWEYKIDKFKNTKTLI